MSKFLRIQEFGAARARVVLTKDITHNIVDGVLRLRLHGLQPGESTHGVLTRYESADCPYCNGKGDTFSADEDRTIDCEPCDGTGFRENCSECGDQISPDAALCESCESHSEDMARVA